MKRRQLLAGLGALAASAAAGLGVRRLMPRRFVRPPSATEAFETRCIGCMRCAEVCFPGAIKADGLLSLGGSTTPYLEPAETACVLCMRCTEVCPTSALTPIAEKLDVIHERVRMGEPVLDRRKCITYNGTGNCRLCYEVCPYPDEAILLVGTGLGPQFDVDQCVGCGLCGEACPDIARAIEIRPFES